MAYTIILDPGHGGYDNGAVYFGRMEKYDNLDLALAVGEILDSNGIKVLFTRTEDIYVSPLERAYMANTVPADYLVSLHRNSSPTPNTYSGVQTLVYSMDDPSAVLAENIDRELAEVGFTNLGTEVRTDLAILRRTDMPAVLAEVGFINTEGDNTLFDERFDDVAYAIATAIMDTLGAPETNDGEETNTGTYTHESSEIDTEYQENENNSEQPVYHIQLGLFRDRNNAMSLMNNLNQAGYNVDVMRQGDLYAVITGDFYSLDEATEAENMLRQQGYSTLIIRSGNR
ncbi:N-acetylmuramoyl-L-alanine amidase [Anaerocolumna xylanovorans]|uniref:N-acetylmuramoyl-L-alanine amidase n=1 Tax=Anaerocolumna xylanovorans DSM 12503 TaxID=1121345 RepID=A0A1M7Y011_9FIRM|nr:N-acetylmuramoyl-L-alanine amidase [Anaerocolumna xylanovorans]SHO44899.1 N-acetylmuramoyl-L-alanine amidase [Anaerocolumna xylanovorans DSM 12503]